MTGKPLKFAVSVDQSKDGLITVLISARLDKPANSRKLANFKRFIETWFRTEVMREGDKLVAPDQLKTPLSADDRRTSPRRLRMHYDRATG